MTKDRLYNDADLASFYDLENGWTSADFEVCGRLATQASSLLDLGCGTGIFAAAMASGDRSVTGGDRSVTGVDPARPMLDIALSRPGGAHVRWVEGDGRTIRLDETFDLVVLTGHAFQVFLTQEDRLAVLRTIAAHLSPQGRFIFDSRNPLAREWEEWVPAASRRTLDHPQFGPVEAWNDMSRDDETGIVTYETHYRVERDGAIHSATSQIAFPPMEEIADLTARAGLEITHVMGDWKGADFDPSMPEIIPVGGLLR